jgi:hypothetical protein
MEKWLYMVQANCVEPTREGELAEWFDKVHIPHILGGSPGFMQAIRYENRSEGQGKYVVVYQIESENIDQTMEKHKANMQRLKEQGHTTELVSVVSRTLCRQVAGPFRK